MAKKKNAGNTGESKRPLEQYTHNDKKRANNPRGELDVSATNVRHLVYVPADYERIAK